MHMLVLATGRTGGGVCEPADGLAPVLRYLTLRGSRRGARARACAGAGGQRARRRTAAR